MPTYALFSMFQFLINSEISSRKWQYNFHKTSLHAFLMIWEITINYKTAHRTVIKYMHVCRITGRKQAKIVKITLFQKSKQQVF